MNTNSITVKLHKKADDELYHKINESLEWIRKATGYSSTPPCKEAVEDFLKAVKGTTLGKRLTTLPLISEAIKVMRETAFAYMRDANRERTVQEFMNKVEALSADINAIRSEQ